MRIAHIALAKRSEGHAGGVPLFGHYLAQRLGAQEYSWRDVPPHIAEQGNRGGQARAACKLGEWMQASGLVATFDAIVVDGFWGRGIRVDPARPLVTVAHNTWRAIGRALSSPGAMHLGESQAEEYHRLPTIAVSRQTARDLQDLYGVRAVATIRNAVDLGVFCPAPRALRPEPLVLYPSDAYPKGGDIVQGLRQRMQGWQFEPIGGEIDHEAEAMQRGDLFLSPSRTEGCSYARLQALACGIPIVASETGIFADGPRLDGILVGTTVKGTTPAHLEDWQDALEQTLAQRRDLSEGARVWSEADGGLDRWEAQWQLLLETSAM